MALVVLAMRATACAGRLGPVAAASAAASVAVARRQPARFAGHSRWAKIARTKGTNDAERSRVKSKLLAAITCAARTGGSDPASNLALAAAMDKARGASVPKDNIERARAGSAAPSDGSESYTIEGRGPGGTAVLVECLTNNRRRSMQHVRRAFVDVGCDVGAVGSVAFMFEGLVRYEVTPAAVGGAGQPPSAWHDTVLEAAMAADARDVELPDADDAGASRVGTAEGEAHGARAAVWCTPDKAAAVRGALTGAGLQLVSLELTRRATTQVELEAGSEDEAAFAALVEALEALDDVQTVHHNAA